MKIRIVSFKVDFAPPVGYKEPTKSESKPEEMAVDEETFAPEATGFVAFKGAGNRLDGKKRKEPDSPESSNAKTVYQRGIPDYNYKAGTLKFIRNSKPPSSVKENKDPNEDFKAFTGAGFSLKQSLSRSKGEKR